MKILNVVGRIDPVTGGGTAERTKKISMALEKAGVQCTILCIDFGVTDLLVESLGGVRVVALRCIVDRFNIPSFSYSEISQLVRDADIVHLMNHWTFLNALVYYIAKKLGKPYVVCPAGALPLFGRSKLKKISYNWVVGKKLIREADAQVAITQDEKAQFEPYGVDAESITVIPNGVSSESYQENDDEGFRQKYAIGPEPFILFIGRLNPIKGPDMLLRAFCGISDKIRPYHLVFVGPDGGMLKELNSIAEKHGVRDRVHFLGYLGGSDKSWAYHAADMLAIPSRQEAMSIVVLESGITSTPVLATDQCGIPEVKDIGGGLIVPTNIKGLEDGLLRMLDNREGLRLMGASLERLVREKYTWDSVADAYMEMYERILGRTSK